MTIKNKIITINSIIVVLFLLLFGGAVIRGQDLIVNNIILVVLLAFFIACLTILIWSYYIQKIISKPVTRLNEVVDKVLKEKNYSIQISKEDDDEVGNLIQNFNELLNSFDVEIGELETQKINLENENIKRTEELSSINKTLDEQVKKLNCLYNIAHLVENPLLTLEEIFQGSLDLIPKSWQYPEITCARIKVEDLEFTSDNFKETKWKLTSDIFVFGLAVGVLEVYYMEEKPDVYLGPFIKEEVSLIEAITERLGKLFEKKKTDLLFQESEERFRIISDSALDAIIMMDEKGEIAFWNPAAEKIFGYTENESIGKSVHMMIAPQRYHDNFFKAFEEFKKTGEGSAVGNVLELSALRKDRTEFPIEISLSAILIKENWWSVALIRDITDRKQAEEELLKAKESAEAANKQLQVAIENEKRLALVAESANLSKSTFLANMSHEIRTPMNGIIGMTQLALDTNLTDEQREYLELVQISAENLLTLINDILDFSKIEANKLELDLIDFNLRSCFDKTINTFSYRAHDKGLELIYQIKFDVPDELIGDPHRLRQIVVNLIDNAIKFTEKGEVALTIGVESESEKEVTLKFSISDTGIGIPYDRQKKIFNAFEQSDGSTTRKYGGTGLGLSISMQLVKLMEGKIYIESEAGVGSTFHFTAKFGLNDAPRPVSKPLKFPRLKNISVIVADDNKTNRKILSDVLTRWSMKPDLYDSAENVLIGLEKARLQGKKYKLALFDVRMPTMDGFELTEKIKKNPDFEDIKVILLTSIGERGDSKRCREIGAEAYLTKPIKNQDLLDAIKTVLGQQDQKSKSDKLVTKHLIEENRRKYRILLAEDNEVNQKLAIKILEKRGHNVFVANNGEETLAALENDSFDLVLMDIQMPLKDGFETTRIIREMEKTMGAHIPIVAMTAHAMKGDRERCLNAGMDDYISKPINAEKLFEIIDGITCIIKKINDNPNIDDSQKNTLNIDDVLLRLDSDISLVNEIIQLFLEDTPQQLEKLNDYILIDDFNGIQQQAHTLKGSSANIGAEIMSDAAYELEKAVKRNDMEEISILCKNLIDKYDYLKTYLTNSKFQVDLSMKV